MAKAATSWNPPQPGTIAPTNLGVARLLEDGTARLQEDGTPRLLEDNVVTPKPTTAWVKS